MKIEWINHASFLLEAGSVRLVTDPWLSGTAFDNGWGLLSPTTFGERDWERVTHIWISHEHPDHFSPPSLRSIPPDLRRRMTVLYQETRDRKVVRYCTELGFGAVRELRPGEWTVIAAGVRVKCQPFPDDDSWLAVEADGQLVLNLNDCPVRRPEEASAILRAIGRNPDGLLTQFSYASWVGNPGDVESHRRHAAEVLDRVILQCEILRPAWVVPFASFVWFCHEENDFLNAEINTVHRAVEAILARSEAQPVVLYPGDRWTAGAEHGNAAALDRYHADYGTLPGRERVRDEPVPLKELGAKAQAFVGQLRARNGVVLSKFLSATRRLQPAHIWLTDHEIAVALDLDHGLRRSTRGRDSCDVAVSSSALAYCFDNLWGGETLQVNGRFSVPPRGVFARFRRYMTLASFANHGRTALHYSGYRAGEAVRQVRDRLSARAGATLGR